MFWKIFDSMIVENWQIKPNFFVCLLFFIVICYAVVTVYEFQRVS